MYPLGRLQPVFQLCRTGHVLCKLLKDGLPLDVTL